MNLHDRQLDRQAGSRSEGNVSHILSTDAVFLLNAQTRHSI